MFEKLIEFVRKEEVTLFIGAGFSIETGAPSVYDLKHDILEKFYNQQQKKKLEDADLSEISETFVEEECSGSREELISLLKSKFEYERKSMDDHKMLANIPHFKTIITTNYDTTLEDSYNENKRSVIRNDKDCVYANKEVNIYKVHGDFTDPDSVIITTSDYNKVDKKHSPMWNKVYNEFTSNHVLFIGYGLKDSNILHIIEDISKAIDKNQKQMFLIAPDVDDERKAELKKLKVCAYKAYASEFLKELELSIVENATKDLNRGWLSASTYSRLCNIHNIEPSIVQKTDGTNKITSMTPLTGFLNHKIEFSLKEDDEEKKAWLSSHDFQLVHTMGSGMHRNIPYIEFCREEILKSRHLVNGLLITDKISKIIISPQEQDVELTINIPKVGFISSATGKCFRINKNTLRMNIDCNIYLLTISLNYPEEDNHPLTINVNFEFNEKYTDNDKAIKWIDLIIAFFNNDEIFIPEFSKNPLIRDKAGYTIPNNYENFKEYYLNIKQIELLMHKKFKKYYQCNEHNFNLSRIILGYLDHSLVARRHNLKEFIFTASVHNCGDLLEYTKDGTEISMVKTDTAPKKYILNDNVYIVPYTHTVLNSCKIIKVKKTDNGDTLIKFKLEDERLYILSSKQPANIDFPDMKPLEGFSKKQAS